MNNAIYGDLVPWYDLLDPCADHADEVGVFRKALLGAIGPGPQPGQATRPTLLELGAGAGNNAFHLKDVFACTLSDLSEPMLGLSRAQNPGCEHVAGDMRTLRLGRTFDAVLVHDAIAYMQTESDLRAAVETAFLHTRPGGAAIFAPDCTRETFEEQSQLHEGEGGDRSLRCLEWMWDPDPGDTTYTVEYALLLRHGTEMKAVHDRHVEGLFPKATWERILRDAGFTVETIRRPLGDAEHIDAFADEVFLARRPEA